MMLEDNALSNIELDAFSRSLALDPQSIQRRRLRQHERKRRLQPNGGGEHWRHRRQRPAPRRHDLFGDLDDPGKWLGGIREGLGAIENRASRDNYDPIVYCLAVVLLILSAMLWLAWLVADGCRSSRPMKLHREK
jgi:hypothetical protein